MTPATLTRIGEALYGDNWKSALAADLGISYRQVLRLSQGEQPIAAHNARRLAELCRQRSIRLGELADTLGA